VVRRFVSRGRRGELGLGAAGLVSLRGSRAGLRQPQAGAVRRRPVSEKCRAAGSTPASTRGDCRSDDSAVSVAVRRESPS